MLPEVSDTAAEAATLVLLPGMDGTGILFEPFLRELPSDQPVKVVAYPADRPMSYEELETLVRNALPPEGPVVLLGESFSGPIAVSLAAALPERVIGLVLCCTFVRNPRPSLAVLAPLLRLASPQLLPNRLAASLLFGRFKSTHLVSLLGRALSSVHPAVLQSRLRAVAAVDRFATLATVTAPVLYLQASEDALVPATAAQTARRARPAMSVASIEGPHCLLQAKPQEAAAAVCGFVRQACAG